VHVPSGVGPRFLEMTRKVSPTENSAVFAHNPGL
jgi:hypothetical protein